jgi:hypothetical protein
MNLQECGRKRSWHILRHCASICLENLRKTILCELIFPSLTAQLIECILSTFFPVALQSLKDLDRLTCRRFLELFRHMAGLLGRVISPSQGLYLHRTTRNSETRGQTSMPWAGFEPTIPATNRPRPTPQTAWPLWPSLSTLHSVKFLSCS